MAEEIYRIRVKQGKIEVEVQGDKEFVEKKYTELKSYLERVPMEVPSIKEREEKKEIRLPGTLAEFYKEKDPKTNVEAVTVIAYYLKYKNDKKEVTNKEIREEADTLGHKITNVAQELKQAAKARKAFMTRGSKDGIWKITAEGEKFVENELPKAKKK